MILLPDEEEAEEELAEEEKDEDKEEEETYEEEEVPDRCNQQPGRRPRNHHHHHPTPPCHLPTVLPLPTPQPTFHLRGWPVGPLLAPDEHGRHRVREVPDDLDQLLLRHFPCLESFGPTQVATRRNTYYG
jgi:hypothetical protein